MKNHNDTIIIGIGNEFRRDDGVGILIARELKKLSSDSFDVIESSGDGGKLLQLWEDYKFVIVIDAVHSGSAAGKIYKFNISEEVLPAQFFKFSSHTFSIAESIELARKLKQLPHRLIIFGIEGSDFTEGLGLSSKVETSSKELIRLIMNELKQ